MLVRCRTLPSDAVAGSDSLRMRASPYTASALAVRGNKPTGTSVEVPTALLTGGTVLDLANFIGTELSVVSAAPLRLSIGGYALPSAEPVAGILREGDELELSTSRSLSASSLANPFQICSVASSGAQHQENGSQVAMEAYVWKARAQELALLAEDRAAQIMMLEGRIQQLNRQVSTGLEARLAAPAQISVTASVDSKQEERIGMLERQNAELIQKLSAMSSQAAAKAKQDVERPAPVTSNAAVSTAQPRYVARTVAELAIGDTVRYQLQFVDVWNGQTRRSGWRNATVAKLMLQDPNDPGVVLRHQSGALDCVEASRLLELQVACGKRNSNS